MPIAALLARWRAGHALPQGFYTQDEVFARDLALLGGRWSFAGHASEVAAAGQWVVAELGAESAIMVRGGDGVLRGLANVCRHRGSRICIEPRGQAALLVCPYHAWSYRLDGRLMQAREMPDGFLPAAHGLATLPVREIGGLVFVSFGAAPPGLEPAAAALAAATAPYRWQDARIAARKLYQVRANWKLVLENYHECYHCAPAHPEFSALHALARPGGRAVGIEEWGPAADGREVFRVMPSALAQGYLSGTRDGALLGPPMGPADGTCVFAELGFLSAFLAYADYGVIYRFVPREVMLTEMEVIWLVRGDATVDEDALTWLWDVTSVADKTIIERNQAGVRSAAYRPGPFSLMEPGTRQFVERYMAEIADKVGGFAPAPPDPHP